MNHQDPRGRTALMLGSSDRDATRELVSAGADTRIGDADGRTALHLAVRHAAADVVAALIEAGGLSTRARKFFF